MTRILITGAAGYVGSHLTRVALNAGCDVIGVVRARTSLTRISDLLADRRSTLTLVECELGDRDARRDLLLEHRPEICVHLAWFAAPGRYLTSEENLEALSSGISLFRELAAAGCTYILGVGSCAEYDTAAGYLRESSPTRPATLYAAAKLALNLVGQQIAASRGIEFGWARLFYLYGSSEHPARLVPAATLSLLRGTPFPATKGDQVRDYLHIEDAATALWSIASARVCKEVNVASAMPVSVRQLLLSIGEIIGCPELVRFGAVEYRSWEPPFVCGDNRKLRLCSGWSPKYVDIHDGLRQTITWWRQHSGVGAT